MSDDSVSRPNGQRQRPEAQAAVAQLAAIRAARTPPIALYTDGGVIGQNPSPIGGTWAWCMVGADGTRTRHAYGYVTPADLDTPTVNEQPYRAARAGAGPGGYSGLGGQWCTATAG